MGDARSPPDAELVASLLCTAVTAEHGWTLTSTSVQPAASPELKWLNRETELFTTLFAVTGGGIGVAWTIWALFGGEYEGSVPIFGVAIAGALIGGLVGAGIDWMVNGVSALARKPARNPPPPQRPPSGPPDLDAARCG